MASNPLLAIRIFKGQKQHQPQKQQQRQGPRRCRGGHLGMAAGARQRLPKTMPRRPSRPCAAARALTAFFVRFAPLPASSAKPSGTRASRDEPAVLTHTRFLKTFGPSALGNAQ
ncbi:MAG TPA: hypothetical protein VG759_14310 [Candidatus Angelobacter sp.]|nr:hypothetical protein [Candidatus Angelobacter sp.]